MRNERLVGKMGHYPRLPRRNNRCASLVPKIAHSYGADAVLVCLTAEEVATAVIVLGRNFFVAGRRVALLDRTPQASATFPAAPAAIDRERMFSDKRQHILLRAVNRRDSGPRRSATRRRTVASRFRPDRT